MEYEYRCLVCDWTWTSEGGETCPKCGEYDDVYSETVGD